MSRCVCPIRRVLSPDFSAAAAPAAAAAATSIPEGEFDRGRVPGDFCHLCGRPWWGAGWVVG